MYFKCPLLAGSLINQLIETTSHAQAVGYRQNSAKAPDPPVKVGTAVGLFLFLLTCYIVDWTNCCAKEWPKTSVVKDSTFKHMGKHTGCWR